MIQFLYIAASLIAGGTILGGCNRKIGSLFEKKKTSPDQFSSPPKNPGDLTWATGRLATYCQRFRDINLESICAPRNADRQQPSSCIRNPNPDKILGIANGWNTLREYDRMIRSACFAFQANNERDGYHILAIALQNSMSEPGATTNYATLIDTLAASEKALELSPQDNNLRKLTAITNGSIADSFFLKNDAKNATLFYERAAALHEAIPTSIADQAEDFNNRLKYYCRLSLLSLRDNNDEKAKKYFNAAFSLFSLLPAGSLTDLAVFDEFVEVYREALKKSPPPVIVNEIEANWESIGRAYLNFAGRNCENPANILSKANEAFKLAGKEKRYGSLIKSTCNPHN